MKIEKENKKVFEVSFVPLKGKGATDYVIAKELVDAERLAKKLFSTRNITKVRRWSDTWNT